MSLSQQQTGRNATGEIGRNAGRKIAGFATIGRNAENHNLANYTLINKLAPGTSRRIAGKCQKNKIGRNRKTAILHTPSLKEKSCKSSNPGYPDPDNPNDPVPIS